MTQIVPFHLVWKPDRSAERAALINVALDAYRTGVRLEAPGFFVDRERIIPWAALALADTAYCARPDRQLKFRFNVKVLARVPEVPYAGAFVGFSRSESYAAGNKLHGFYPLDYWRLNADGAVEWGKVCGPTARDQLPVSCVHCFDIGQDPVAEYRSNAMWDFTCFVDPNEVEPGHVRNELVIAVRLMGRPVATWRSIDERPLRPIAYVEGAVLEQQVLVSEEEVS